MVVEKTFLKGCAAKRATLVLCLRRESKTVQTAGDFISEGVAMEIERGLRSIPVWIHWRTYFYDAAPDTTNC